MEHISLSELNDKLSYILDSPKDKGVLRMIVRRPDVGQREVIQEGLLSAKEGLIGDNWIKRGSRKTEDGSSHPEMQLTLMNSRVIESITQNEERWELAGDQLFVDLDLSEENLPAGTRLKIGGAEIEVTSIPHTGC